jgi:hypothetical protein
MSQGRLVTGDVSLGGRIMWVEMLRGRIVGGWIVKVKAPNWQDLVVILAANSVPSGF